MYGHERSCALVFPCVSKSPLVCTSFTSPKMLLSRFLSRPSCKRRRCVREPPCADRFVSSLCMCRWAVRARVAPASGEPTVAALRRAYAVAHALESTPLPTSSDNRTGDDSWRFVIFLLDVNKSDSLWHSLVKSGDSMLKGHPLSSKETVIKAALCNFWTLICWNDSLQIGTV